MSRKTSTGQWLKYVIFSSLKTHNTTYYIYENVFIQNTPSYIWVLNLSLSPPTQGPFKGFLEALVKLQKKFYDSNKRSACPIQTFLLTSRGAGSAGYRALNTLKTWGLQIDQAFFLNGSPKGPLLEVIRPHIFFDDQQRHVNKALDVGTVAGLVPCCKNKHPKKLETTQRNRNKKRKI